MRRGGREDNGGMRGGGREGQSRGRGKMQDLGEDEKEE